jgi:hypothetical protein
MIFFGSEVPTEAFELPYPITGLHVSGAMDRKLVKIPLVGGAREFGASKAVRRITVSGIIETLDVATYYTTIQNFWNAVTTEYPAGAGFAAFRFFTRWHNPGKCRWFESCILEDLGFDDLVGDQYYQWQKSHYNLSVIALDPELYAENNHSSGATNTYVPPVAQGDATTTISVYGGMVIRGDLVVKNTTSGNTVARIKASNGSIHYIGSLENTATLA